MAIGKAKVPEYPRPVSPVSADEHPICRNTIVYDEGDESSEDSEMPRAAKRRRIESYATAYLRGETLFIASAQLKGPFSNGWQNPWRRRGGQRPEKETARLEVPETTIRSQPRRSARSLHHGARMSSSRSTPISPVIQPIKQTLTSSQANVLNAVSSNLQASVTHTGVPSSKNQQVEDWLKKNDGYSKAEEHQPHSSPTPMVGLVRVRTKKWESPVINIEFPPLVDDVVSLAALPPLRQPDLRNGRAVLPMTEPQQPKSELCKPMLIASGSVGPTLETTSQHMQENVLDVKGRSKPIAESDPPAEITSFAAKRRSLHTIPPSSHLPAFEYRRAIAREATHSIEPAEEVNSAPEAPAGQTTEADVVPDADNQVDSNGQSASLHTAEERLSSGLPGITTVLPDNVHPNQGTPNDIPSAQIPTQMPLQSAPSNLSGTGVLLQEPEQGIAQTAYHSPLKQILPDATEPPTEDSLSKSFVALEQSVDKNTPLQSVQVPAPLHLAVTPNPKLSNPSDTQEMIESITPFEFSTVKKNKAGRIQNIPALRTATKTRTTRIRKRASFAPEEASSGSAAGSLKAVMKVAKSAIVNLDSLKGLKSTWDDEDEDINSMHHIQGSTPRFASSEVAMKIGTPRGILKPSSNPSAPAPTGTHRTSSSAKQDAQQVRALDMIEGELEQPQDDFDVNAAIDDLGSFLGTWDVEKEALGFSEAQG
ncbi:uncharacterized protein A1O9_08419 [Exophiala aquamarina CBS 119918]|uniref:Uncharacterized protein n=1 Tax=Exophiala aquamarina CBS 119918 TaxID=1182545 RepID=A0A072P6C5_9EURO|nr:uncharacterized protein A1O9_08419 [Exophiala aquamarina CBS 119918]KEF55669.1 hypothetical protein A1O9_08419 [Exophiala aquamarina CBS 119918]